MDPVAGWVVLALIAAVLVVAVLFRTVKVVPQGRAGVVERLGRYLRTVQPGLNLVVPVLDRVRVLVDLQEQKLEIPSPVCITEAGDRLAVDAVLRYRVTEPVKAVYQVSDLRQALEQLTTTILRDCVGWMNTDRARSGYHELSQLLRERLPRQSREWGVELASAEITSIRPAGSGGLS